MDERDPNMDDDPFKTNDTEACSKASLNCASPLPPERCCFPQRAADLSGIRWSTPDADWADCSTRSSSACHMNTAAGPPRPPLKRPCPASSQSPYDQLSAYPLCVNPSSNTIARAPPHTRRRMSPGSDATPLVAKRPQQPEKHRRRGS